MRSARQIYSDRTGDRVSAFDEAREHPINSFAEIAEIAAQNGRAPTARWPMPDGTGGQVRTAGVDWMELGRVGRRGYVVMQWRM